MTLKNNYEFSLVKNTKKDLKTYMEKNPKLIKSIPVTTHQLNKVYTDYYNDPYKEAKTGKVKNEIC